MLSEHQWFLIMTAARHHCNQIKQMLYAPTLRDLPSTTGWAKMKTLSIRTMTGSLPRPFQGTCNQREVILEGKTHDIQLSGKKWEL